MGGSVGGTIARGLGDVATFGTNELVGNPIGKLASGSLFGGPDVAQVGGQQSPMQMLTSSGGAPLLMNIALGADVGTSLMGYFGASGDYNKWFNGLSPTDQQSVQGLHDQLTQIQTNTDMRNQAVTQLATDFPNIMAAKIPQYSAMADTATKQMMDQAMQQISATQAAGGAFSSGATAEAAARAGAGIGMEKLQYGTNLALQDFTTQFNNATALQTFQQKMLGQGATQGFNAIQNALSRNANINSQNASAQNQANDAAYSSQQGMLKAVGAGLGYAMLSPSAASAALPTSPMPSTPAPSFPNTTPSLNLTNPSAGMGGYSNPWR